MKKLGKIITIILLLFISLFFYFKWNELKYILRFDNSKSHIVEKNINIGKISLGDSTIVQFKIVNIGNKPTRAIAVNGQIPMPTLTFTEGDTAEIYVHN